MTNRRRSNNKGSSCSFTSIIIFFLILSHHYALGKRFNLTRLLEQQLQDQYYIAPSNYKQYPTIVDDILYIPELDYIDDAIDYRESEKQLNKKDQEFFLRRDRNLMAEYRNLCEIKTRTVQLNDEEYEYQPPHYHETYCKNYYVEKRAKRTKPSKQQCVHPGFHCVQRSKVMFMVRRRWTEDCWEPVTRQIASGCDCMWPVSSLGEISAHYK